MHGEACKRLCPFVLKAGGARHSWNTTPVNTDTQTEPRRPHPRQRSSPEILLNVIESLEHYSTDSNANNYYRRAVRTEPDEDNLYVYVL